MRYRYTEVTKREILFSIVIVAVMLLFGFIIHGKISDNLMLKQQEYNTALQIEENKDLFEYGMKTNVGNAFVYGELKALDPVTYPEIGGSYSYIEKVKERYTEHSRTVTKTRTNSKGETEYYTETEYYWEWDRVGSWEKRSKKISFLDVEYNYGTIKFPGSSYITTKKESSRIRYVYYGTAASFKGTLYANLTDNTISNTHFYANKNITETLEHLETGWELILFWFFWVILTGGCVFGFVYIDNKWLEDKKHY